MLTYCQLDTEKCISMNSYFNKFQKVYIRENDTESVIPPLVKISYK